MSWLILLGLYSLFFIVLLAFKSIIDKEYCTICVANVCTWISLLVLYALGIYTDLFAIGLLVALSISGLYYLAERWASVDLLIYRLPFLLTLLTFAYLLLGHLDQVMQSITFLVALWMVFLALSKLPARKIIKKIVECCGQW